MLIIFTGNGKGKTTAALGQALRAVGDGKRVLMVQFIKGPWKSGEDISHRKLFPRLKIIKKGLGFVGIGNDAVPFEDHAKAAHEALARARCEATRCSPFCPKTPNVDMLILDEVNNAVALKLLTEGEVLAALDDIMPHVEHVILTGRDAPQAFIDRAELVTEMRDIKHPFHQGTTGKKGLEY